MLQSINLAVLNLTHGNLIIGIKMFYFFCIIESCLVLDVLDAVACVCVCVCV